MFFDSSISGEQDKEIVDNYFIKYNKRGYEGFAEAFISQFLYFTDLDFVDYHVIPNGCKCKLYRDLACQFATLDKVLREFNMYYIEDYEKMTPSERFDFCVSVVKDMLGIDCTGYIGRLCFLDAITVNTDRHLGNFEFYNSNGVWTSAPVFDNGAGLLSEFPITMSIDKGLKLCGCKPFSTDFKEQVQMLGSKNIPLIKVRFYEMNDYFKSLVVDDAYSLLFTRCRQILYKRLYEYKNLAWEMV